MVDFDRESIFPTFLEDIFCYKVREIPKNYYNNLHVIENSITDF